MGSHIGQPLQDSVGFRGELRRNVISYCRDRRPRRSVIVRIKVYVAGLDPSVALLPQG